MRPSTSVAARYIGASFHESVSTYKLAKEAHERAPLIAVPVAARRDEIATIVKATVKGLS